MSHLQNLMISVWIILKCTEVFCGHVDCPPENTSYDPFWSNREHFVATFVRCRYQFVNPEQAPLANSDNFQFMRRPNENQWEAGNPLLFC